MTELADSAQEKLYLHDLINSTLKQKQELRSEIQNLRVQLAQLRNEPIQPDSRVESARSTPRGSVVSQVSSPLPKRQNQINPSKFLQAFSSFSARLDHLTSSLNTLDRIAPRLTALANHINSKRPTTTKTTPKPPPQPQTPLSQPAPAKALNKRSGSAVAEVELERLAAELASAREDVNLLVQAQRDTAKHNSQLLAQKNDEISRLKTEISKISSAPQAPSPILIAASTLAELPLTPENLPSIETALVQAYFSHRALEIVAKHLKACGLYVPRPALARRLNEIISDWNFARNSRASRGSMAIPTPLASVSGEEAQPMPVDGQKLALEIEDLKVRVRNYIVVFFANAKRKIDNSGTLEMLCEVLEFGKEDRVGLNELLRTPTMIECVRVEE
mgnify:CR=1 FL=1